jgi:hypothetical protein
MATISDERGGKQQKAGEKEPGGSHRARSIDRSTELRKLGIVFRLRFDAGDARKLG